MTTKTIQTQTPSGKRVVIILSGMDATATIAEIGLSGELHTGYQGQSGSAMVKIADKLVLIPANIEREIKAHRAANRPVDTSCKLWTRDEGCPMHGESCHESALRGLDNIDAYSI